MARMDAGPVPAGLGRVRQVSPEKHPAWDRIEPVRVDGLESERGVQTSRRSHFGQRVENDAPADLYQALPGR